LHHRIDRRRRVRLRAVTVSVFVSHHENLPRLRVTRMRFSDKRTQNGTFPGFFATAPVKRFVITLGLYLIVLLYDLI
jgi:hypothetical protein